MRKVLLVAFMFLLASSSVASVDQHKASQLSERQALAKQATQGSAEAQYKLGRLYMIGEGGPQNDTEAAKWFRKAAAQGHVDAQYSLAIMYSVGLGVQHDIAQAAKWYQEAADQGDADSQAALAALYYRGLGVPRSKVSAYQWAKISMTNPSLRPDDRSDVQEVLDTLTAELTSTEIAKAEKLVKHWQAKAGNGSPYTP